MVCWILLILSCVNVFGLQATDVKQDLENVVYEMQKTLQGQTLYIKKLEKRLKDQEILSYSQAEIVKTNQRMQSFYIKKLEKRLRDQEVFTSKQAEILKNNQRKLERLEITVSEQKELILKSEKNKVKNNAEKQDSGKGHRDMNNFMYPTNFTDHNENGKDLLKSITSRSRQNVPNEKVISRPKRAVATDTGVAFYAYMPTKEVHPGPDHTLIFRSVVTNVGNPYNQHNGIFTSPSHGVYVFSWTIVVYDYIGTELLVNSNPVGAMYSTAYDVSDLRTTTGMVVVELNENDVVYLRVNADSSVHHKGDIESSSYYKTSFCGWKLF